MAVEEDATEGTTVAVADTATIVIATTAEDAEMIFAWEIGAAVRWTMTTADVDEMTFVVDETIFAADAIDRPTGEALRGAAVTIAAAVVLEADRHHAVTTAETTEEAVTPEALLAGAMMIAIVVAMMIIETEDGAVADTTMTSAVVPQKCTAETIAEETIADIVIRGLVSNHSRPTRGRMSSWYL